MAAAPPGPPVNRFALKSLRLGAGLTQTELGKRVGTHPAHICRIESGQRPRPSLALTTAVASVLGVPVQALLAAGEVKLTKRAAK